MFERKEFRWLCLSGLFFVYSFLAFKDAVLPYLIDDIVFAFNTDNFWSYSSGFIRRALLGQILYFNQSVLGIGPWFFSFTTFALVVLFAGYVCVELNKTTPAWQVILLALTPFALLYFVDAEILMLLPLLAMVQNDSRHQKLFVLLLIMVLSQMRELILVLYFPVLLRFIFIDRGLVGKASIAFIAVMSFLLLWDFGPPSYVLEKTFWPEHGAPNLHEEHMYTFAEMSFTEMLDLHVGSILEFFIPAMIFWVLLAASLFWFLAKRITSPILFAWFVGTFLVSSILSIDHGRYAYFFFMFAVLFSADTRQRWFDLNLFDHPWWNHLHTAFTPAHDWFARTARIMLPVSLGLLIIAPSGYYTGLVLWKPRAYEVVVALLQQVL